MYIDEIAQNVSDGRNERQLLYMNFQHHICILDDAHQNASLGQPLIAFGDNGRDLLEAELEVLQLAQYGNRYSAHLRWHTPTYSVSR